MDEFMDEEERRRAFAWAQNEAAKRTVNFHFPDREPREPNATIKQREYVRHLLPGVDEKVLASLGKWQASGLIDEVKYQQDKMTQQLLDEWLNKKQKKGFFKWLFS